jgi:hypothetical protein
MKSATVKPMPATAATPISCGHVAPSGRTAIRSRDREPCRAGDADDFADDQPDRHAHHDPGCPGAFECRGIDCDPGVGQREDGDDEVARDRVQRMLQALGGTRRLVVVRLRRRSEDLPILAAGTSRGEQPEHDTRDRRVHAGPKTAYHNASAMTL